MDDLKPDSTEDTNQPDAPKVSFPQPTLPKTSPMTEPTIKPALTYKPSLQTTVTTEEPGVAKDDSLPKISKPRRTKIISSLVVLFLLLVSIPVGVYLVKQRQEIRSSACWNEGNCLQWRIYVCDKGTFEGRVRQKGTTSWQKENLVNQYGGCYFSPYFNYNFDLSDGDWVEWELEGINIDRFESGEYQVSNCPIPTPTPTPAPSLFCFDLTSEPAPIDLKEGDALELTCRGSSGAENPVDHAEFRFLIEGQQVGGIESADVTEVDGQYQGIIEYTIPQIGHYRIECRVCTSAECTQWGQAEVATP